MGDLGSGGSCSSFFVPLLLTPLLDFSSGMKKKGSEEPFGHFD